MYAIDNDKLNENKTAGKYAICPNCKKKKEIIWAKNEEGKECKMIGAVKCGENDYLVAIDGKLLEEFEDGK